MALMLTSKSEITQVKSGLWRTNNNELMMLDNGRMMFVPRNFETDNITFISCDFADVRASHFHDVGCKYHQVIYTTLNLEQLCLYGLLSDKTGKWICEDIPVKYLYTEKVGFNEINHIFKQALLACHENKVKSWAMFAATYLNVNWLFYRFNKKQIDFNKFYNEVW